MSKTKGQVKPKLWSPEAKSPLGVVVVVEDEPGSGRLVLTEETDEHKKRLRNFPGGALNWLKIVNLWEDPEVAGPRETTEESGLQVELTGILGIWNIRQSGKFHVAYSAVKTGGELTPVKKDKHPRADGFTVDEIDLLHKVGLVRDDRVPAFAHRFFDEPPIPMSFLYSVISDTPPRIEDARPDLLPEKLRERIA